MNKLAEELISLISKESNEEITKEVLNYYQSIKGRKCHDIHNSNGIIINQFTPEQGNTL